jgi:hypothetical protein
MRAAPPRARIGVARMHVARVRTFRNALARVNQHRTFLAKRHRGRIDRNFARALFITAIR